MRDRRRAVTGAGIGLGPMIIWIMAIYPSVETELPDYVDAMPDAMKSIFGIDDITSLAGFVHAEVFTVMGPIVFLALAIGTGANTVAGEERDRILPIVLSTGLSRCDLLLSKLAALALDLAALAAITLAAPLGGLRPAGGGIGVAAATAATFQLGQLGRLFGTLALAVGAATPDARPRP
jgi:ABC-2 type transport system permease protein